MKIKIIGSLLALALMACGPRVSTVKVTDKDLSSYTTFAYLPNSNFDDYVKFETDNSVGMAVIENVNRNMQQVGYKMDRNNPDLAVLLSTTTDIEKTVFTDPVFATYPRYYDRRYAVSPYYQNYYYYNYTGFNKVVGFETDVDRYKEGTLLLYLIDSKSKEVVWKGTASELIFQQSESQAISKFVDDMFDKFPTAK
jgi:hypothetical protein